MGGFWKHKEGTSVKSEVLLRPTGASTLDKALLQSPSLQQENSPEESSGCPLGVLEGKASEQDLVLIYIMAHLSKP